MKLRLSLSLAAALAASATTTVSAQDKYDPTAVASKYLSTLKVGAKDWPMWGGWNGRNNTPDGKNIPIKWDVESGENIKWKASLGSQTYGNPVVANGKVYVGTNNGAGYIKRYPSSVDLGALVCFDEKTGEFLWQHSSPKLPTGRVHDWPLQGICCSPAIDGNRVWFVSSRGEVVCCDAEGFRDGENDGPYKTEANEDKYEADILWRYDMMAALGVSQHNMCSCSVTFAGDVLFVITANGVDESHINIPAPEAPSFIAMDRNTGKVLWTDKSPGINVLHGQWSSPTFAVFNGQEQVMFAGGDSWLYCFDPKGDGKGNAKLLWKFDTNPKDSKWILGGRGTRNELIATPVVYDGNVYISVGQDPEHGEGIGHMWCIDPNKRGDVSPTLVKDKDGKAVEHRRLVAAEEGDKVELNPNSAAIWRYSKSDRDGNGKVDFEETMHRTIGTVAIKNDLIFCADYSGLFHCVDAKAIDKTQKNEDGTHPPKAYWTYDMFAASWGSPLIVEDKVYMGDEDGDIVIFALSKEQKQLGEINMGNAVYSTPVVANDTLFIANKSTLYAIGKKD